MDFRWRLLNLDWTLLLILLSLIYRDLSVFIKLKFFIYGNLILIFYLIKVFGSWAIMLFEALTCYLDYSLKLSCLWFTWNSWPLICKSSAMWFWICNFRFWLFLAWKLIYHFGLVQISKQLFILLGVKTWSDKYWT